MVLLERPLMADNATELPQLSRFILHLAKVVHELIVGYNIFKLIIIHRDNKLHTICMICKILIVILNSMNDMSMVMGAIFLFVHEKNTTNPIIRINYRKLSMTILLPIVLHMWSGQIIAHLPIR
jgi:hypothetical protein